MIGFRPASLLAWLCVALAASTVAPATAAPADCPPPARALTPEGLRAGLADARDRGFFWRITKDGRTSYLYGTVHAARYEWMFPGPTLQAAVRGADVLALELDILDPQIQRRLATAIRAKEGDTLPAPLAERLQRRMAAECADEAAYASFAPEFAVASLGMLAARRDGLDPSHAIDLVLDVYARDVGRPVVSLETPESQLQALRLPTREQTLAFVRDALDDLDSGKSRPLVRRIARIWTESDYADLDRFEQWCGCVDTAVEAAAMRRLLDDRNPGLADGIDAIHGGGRTVFAAVGSLHMVGATGLPALMTARGYRVEQVDFGR